MGTEHWFGGFAGFAGRGECDGRRREGAHGNQRCACSRPTPILRVPPVGGRRMEEEKGIH